MARKKLISEEIQILSDDEYAVVKTYSDGTSEGDIYEYNEDEGPGYYNEFDEDSFSHLTDD